MKIIYQDKEYACSFELALDMLSGKWKGLILWHLSHGTMRYGELKCHKIRPFHFPLNISNASSKEQAYSLS